MGGGFPQKRMHMMKKRRGKRGKNRSDKSNKERKGMVREKAFEQLKWWRNEEVKSLKRKEKKEEKVEGVERNE